MEMLNMEPIDATATTSLQRNPKTNTAYCLKELIGKFTKNDDDDKWKLEGYGKVTYAWQTNPTKQYNPKGYGPCCARRVAKEWGVTYINNDAVLDTSKLFNRYSFIKGLLAARARATDGLNVNDWALDIAIVEAMERDEGFFARLK